MLITRKDLSYAIGKSRTALSRGGRRGDYPMGSYNEPSGRYDSATVGFCYTREEAQKIADFYNHSARLPDHLFRVSPDGLRSAPPGHALDPEEALTDAEWHGVAATALKALAQAHYKLSRVPDRILGSLIVDAPEPPPEPVESAPAPTFDPENPMAEFNRLITEGQAELRRQQEEEAARLPSHVEQPPPRPAVPAPDIFAHLDEDARILAPANLKRGFRVITKHDWTYANRLIQGWDGVTMTDNEYSLYATDPDNWSE